mgnify:CR=1 FL=1
MYDSIEQIIAEKGIYTGLTRGTSMWPLIHQGRDNIIICLLYTSPSPRD